VENERGISSIVNYKSCGINKHAEKKSACHSMEFFASSYISSSELCSKRKSPPNLLYNSLCKNIMTRIVSDCKV
jgi:hypothetical protein